MPKLALENVCEGMHARIDVCDATGRLLVPAGTSLTSNHLSILRKWGVLEVEIGGDSDDVDQHCLAVTPEIAAHAAKLTEWAFQHVPSDHPLIVVLRAEATARVTDQLLEETLDGC
ncbi:hypothetical protein Pan216_51280 [Planctomycetes bacterium Pan216]|uniref:Uncharacterized protein n=1 Tax=Kolteria novifilia TaxID=2527975 RepID=A0A518BB83_9BACT|nr:hypothetical protein Pan216_51280 [Planctomycetes bacterium Pan216]